MGTNQPLKRPFLTVYDYGQGGVWVVLPATSAEKVREKYPELQVLDRPPPSMSKEELEDISSRRTLDIDDDQDSFLACLRASRHR
jgi:hypothetical protein